MAVLTLINSYSDLDPLNSYPKLCAERFSYF
jgi:hypothetical protein